MTAPAWFIPDRDPPRYYPLREFLRLPSESVAAAYIAALSSPGDLIVDPFATSPTIARAAQKLGRRVLAVESNPLWSWLSRTMARPRTANEINAALARLGDTLKDDVPLRTYVNRAYETTCAACHRPTPAAYLVHNRETGPVLRHYTCAQCGETRDDPATEGDAERAASFDAHGLPYHFAFERVVPADNLHAERIRRILDLYTPRNLDMLVALTVKIDALFREPRERETLLLLLLHALDRGASFYPAPDAPARLSNHKQFVEFNLWDAMETAAHALAEHAPEPLANLVDAPDAVTGSTDPLAFIGRGSPKALARAIPEGSAALVLTAPPVRRLGIWALSYFWGAWILGRAAVESLVVSLDPHKPDPSWERRWYYESMTGSLEAIAALVRHDGATVFSFYDDTHEVMETVLLAGAGARLQLERFLFQPELGDTPRREFDGIAGSYRIVFRKVASPPLKLLSEAHIAGKLKGAALEAAREVLERRAEPLAYSWVHHAAYARAAGEGHLAQVMSANTKSPPNRFVYYAVREGLTEGYAHDLDHYESPDQFVWLVHRQTAHPPLVDRVDDAVSALVRAHSPLSHDELLDRIYREFPGDLTPEAGLIELCARAYGERRDDAAWHAYPSDSGAERSHALDVLARLGERLEYRITSAAPFDMVWEWDGEMAHGFVWRERARPDDLAQTLLAPARGYVVVPESQVPVLRERFRRLPLRAEAFHEAGWHLLRVPYVEQLLQQEKIERHDILLITGLVPPVSEPRAQLELF